MQPSSHAGPTQSHLRAAPLAAPQANAAPTQAAPLPNPVSGQPISNAVPQQQQHQLSPAVAPSSIPTPRPIPAPHPSVPQSLVPASVSAPISPASVAPMPQLQPTPMPPVTPSAPPTMPAPIATSGAAQAPVPARQSAPIPSPAHQSTITAPLQDDTAETDKIRRSLVKRLSDVICIPGSQITPQERHMAGDILVEMLRDADMEMRESVAKRLVLLNEAPRTILVLLAKDDISVARHVLEESKSLTDSDLIQISRKVTTEHRKVIARRRHIADAVTDTLVEFLEEDVVEILLKNKGASFSETALQRILTVSRGHKPYITGLIERVELRPSHGLSMFWWAEEKERKKILKRFGVTRAVLQDSCADLYPRAAKDAWSDASVRKALQFIERRQRNRAAMARSEYEGLEQAIDIAEATGLTPELTLEISYMAGVKPATGVQILTDKGGEGIAIFCKAPGLKRPYLAKIWRALRRPIEDANGNEDPDFARVVSTYDHISTDKAQTILRYWNWSLTSAMNPEVMEYINKGMIPTEEDHGAAAITAALVFGNKS